MKSAFSETIISPNRYKTCKSNEIRIFNTNN